MCRWYYFCFCLPLDCSSVLPTQGVQWGPILWCSVHPPVPSIDNLTSTLFHLHNPLEVTAAQINTRSLCPLDLLFWIGACFPWGTVWLLFSFPFLSLSSFQTLPSLCSRPVRHRQAEWNSECSKFTGFRVAQLELNSQCHYFLTVRL